jgi:hypothetical protein
MQVTQKYWAVAETTSHIRGKYEVKLFNWDPSGLSHYMLIREEPYEITIDIPDSFDLREAQASQIRAEIKKVQAESQNQITILTQQLNNLLAIEG